MKQLTSNNYEMIQINELTNVRFYTSVDPGSYVAPHWHDAVEIVYLKEGELFYTTEDNTRKVPIGSCILTSPQIIHSTFCSSPNTAIVFQIPTSFLEKYVPNARYMKFQMLDPSNDPIVHSKIDMFKMTLDKMQAMIDLKPDGALLRFNSLLFDAIFQLTHSFVTMQSESAISNRTKNLNKLKDVLIYIQEHYNEPITLSEVSAIAMYEQKYFCRFFKQILGTTFLEYQNMLRISKIYDDIQNTHDPIQKILERHGFTNYKLFRRMFTDQFHATPSEIRKQKSI